MQWRINIPPLTRILLALLLVISSVYQIIRFVNSSASDSWDFLSLIPQRSVFYPWVFFTATFAERNVVTLVIAGATVLYGGKYLERAWDTREFGKFVLVVTVIPNLAASLTYVLWFAVSRNDSHMYVAKIRIASLFVKTDIVAAGLPFKGRSPCKLRSWWHSSSWCPNTRSRS